MDLAEDFSGRQVILDHGGRPANHSPESLIAWRNYREKAATGSDIAIKISGLEQPGGRTLSPDLRTHPTRTDLSRLWLFDGSNWTDRAAI
jgi:predicted TIM-barrel fold metal-dependent hydrolase